MNLEVSPRPSFAQFKGHVERIIEDCYPNGLTALDAFTDYDFLGYVAEILHAMRSPDGHKGMLWQSAEGRIPFTERMARVFYDLSSIEGDAVPVLDLLGVAWGRWTAMVPELEANASKSYRIYSCLKDTRLAELVPQIIVDTELVSWMEAGNGHFAWAGSSDVPPDHLAAWFFYQVYPHIGTSSNWREISLKGAAGTQGEVADVLDTLHARSRPLRRMSKHERAEVVTLPHKLLGMFKELTQGYRFFTNGKPGRVSEGDQYWYENGGGQILTLIGVRGTELLYLDARWSAWAE